MAVRFVDCGAEGVLNNTAAGTADDLVLVGALDAGEEGVGT